MLKYPSTKTIILAAFVSTTLAACGGGGDKSSAQTPVTTPPPIAAKPVSPELKLADLPQDKEGRVDNEYATQVGISALKATLFADTSTNALRSSMSEFAATPLPKDSASGWLAQLDKKCQPSGQFSLTLTKDEGATPTTLHNQMDTHFGADFDNCIMKSGSGDLKIDGLLGIDLSLNIAKIIGASSFSIETGVKFDNFSVNSGQQQFFANGSASYSFGTQNGQDFTSILDIKSLNLNTGNLLALVDFKTEQTFFTADSSYSITAKGKYSDLKSKTYVDVEVLKAFAGTGYGYPNTGKLSVVAGNASVIITILKTTDLEEYPEGSLVKVEQIAADGVNGGTSRLHWKEVTLQALFPVAK